MRMMIRIALILVIAYLAHLGLGFVDHQLNATPSGNMRLAMSGLVLVTLLLYAVLIALPFVPGIEIGISLLMMQGADVAPLVFLATFSGLSIAFLVGQWMPSAMLIRLLEDFHLSKAAALVARLSPLDRQQRLEILSQRPPKRLSKALLRYRYLALALAFNTPGNALIGGGGGIALIAGLTGLFSTRLTLIWIALAVAPFPLLVMIFGKSVL